MTDAGGAASRGARGGGRSTASAAPATGGGGARCRGARHARVARPCGAVGEGGARSGRIEARVCTAGRSDRHGGAGSRRRARRRSGATGEEEGGEAAVRRRGSGEVGWGDARAGGWEMKNDWVGLQSKCFSNPRSKVQSKHDQRRAAQICVGTSGGSRDFRLEPRLPVQEN